MSRLTGPEITDRLKAEFPEAKVKYDDYEWEVWLKLERPEVPRSAKVSTN